MENKLTITDTTANPAPLGLCGFGLTTTYNKTTANPGNAVV